MVNKMNNENVVENEAVNDGANNSQYADVDEMLASIRARRKAANSAETNPQSVDVGDSFHDQELAAVRASRKLGITPEQIAAHATPEPVKPGDIKLVDGKAIIKSLNHSKRLNEWTYQVSFARAKHPVLSSMFKAEEGDVITRMFSYHKWAIRQHIPEIDAMTRKQAEEMLTIALVVIDRAASISLEECWVTEEGEQFDKDNKEHQHLRHHYWRTIQTWLDVWVRLRE